MFKWFERRLQRELDKVVPDIVEPPRARVDGVILDLPGQRPEFGSRVDMIVVFEVTAHGIVRATSTGTVRETYTLVPVELWPAPVSRETDLADALLADLEREPLFSNVTALVRP